GIPPTGGPRSPYPSGDVPDPDPGIGEEPLADCLIAGDSLVDVREVDGSASGDVEGPLALVGSVVPVDGENAVLVGEAARVVGMVKVVVGLGVVAPGARVQRPSEAAGVLQDDVLVGDPRPDQVCSGHPCPVAAIDARRRSPRGSYPRLRVAWTLRDRRRGGHILGRVGDRVDESAG